LARLEEKKMSTNPDERIFESPVRWLLGRQLVGALKGALLYAAYGKKIDPRDWMASVPVTFPEESTEFWFDYLSDIGDGTRAMYSSAYLAMCRSLGTKLRSTDTDLPSDPQQCEVTTIPDAQAEFSYQLPRGEFLFVGGDTAYHAASYITLVNRIQHPFRYAYEDLVKNKLISNEDPRRPIFGIPGNHDYYDQVDGFRRQFRKPTRPEGPLPPAKSKPGNAQLTIPGFQRVQEASYVALRLPFGWWFWGLDTEPGLIDLRQRKFFQDLATVGQEFQPPDKLILATCSPSTVVGHLAAPDDFKVAKSIDVLRVGMPFLPDNVAGKPDFSKSGNGKLNSGQCRLDLSGDVHHYARYWGPKPANGSVPRQQNTAPRPDASSYASVVSGAAGAFHHPTTTYDDQICEQVLYPSEQVSREAIGNEIAAFWNVINGGYIWLVGFIIAFLIFFGAAVVPSSSQFVGKFAERLNHFGLEVVSPEDIKPTIVQDGACNAIEPFGLWTMLGLVPATSPPPQPCQISKPSYFIGPDHPWPPDLIIGAVFLFVALLALGATIAIASFTKLIFTDRSIFSDPPDPNKKLWPIVIGITILVGLGFLSVTPYRDHITPFVSSILVFFSIFTAVVAIVLAIRYNGYLFQKSFHKTSTGTSDWILPFTLWILAILFVGATLWLFGKNNLPAFLLSDILFLTAVIALVFSTIALPLKVGGDLLCTKPKWLRIVGKLLIAVWHLVLQLFVPYLLIRTGNVVLWILAAVLLVLPIPLTKLLIKKNSAIGVTLLWVVYGAVMLTLPWLTMKGLSYLNVPYVPVFTTFAGWKALVPTLLAGGAGAVICCLWTGWYFVVTFLFNGHNNEVGGAARVEGFKQFIRFRLTREGLTGYVIAVDDVSKIGEVDAQGRTMDGSDLKPRLVDVFQLRPKA
jgi:hypothetical protein